MQRTINELAEALYRENIEQAVFCVSKLISALKPKSEAYRLAEQLLETLKNVRQLDSGLIWKLRAEAQDLSEYLQTEPHS